MSRRLFWSLAPALLLVAGCSGGPAEEAGATAAGVDLVPLPEPDLQGMDEPVRESILRLRGALEQAAEHDRSRVYGELGRTYYAIGLQEAAEACFANASRLDEQDFASLYFLGLIELERGRLDEAVVTLEQVLRMEQDYTAARVRLGKALIELGNSERGRQELERAMQEQPFAAAAHYSLGQLAAREGDHQKAVEHFERVLSMQPQATRVHYPLGQSYRRLGDNRSAASHVERSGDREVTHPDPLTEALRDLASGVGDILNTSGRAFFEGLFAEAADGYRRAIEIDPDNVEAHKGLALALERLGDNEGAEERFREALRLRPDDPGVVRGLGLLMLSRGALDEALEHLHRAERLDPGSVDSQVALARALGQAGRPGEAMAHYDKALAIDPSHPGATLDRAALLVANGRKDEAETILEALLEGEIEPPVRARALFNLGVIESTRGSALAARERYREALDADPGLGEARLFYAADLAREGRYGEAAEHLQLLVDREPDNLRARLAEATALVFAGRHGRAVQRLDEGIARTGGDARLALALAKLLATCPDDAVRDGARALSLAQQLYGARRTLEHAEVLAMAFAETGDFDQAIAIQKSLVASAAEMGEAGLADQFERDLVRYERGEPSRAPWPGLGGEDEEGDSR